MEISNRRRGTKRVRRYILGQHGGDQLSGHHRSDSVARGGESSNRCSFPDVEDNDASAMVSERING